MHAFNTYSSVMFTPESMRKVIRHLAQVLPSLQEQFDFNTIVVTGKSGIALGFALSMMTGIKVVAVRKGESSHGDMVEGDGTKFERYAFFDDNISSGRTQARVARELNRRAEARNLQPAKRVLNILYSDAYPGGGLDVHDNFGPTYRVPGVHRLPEEHAVPFQL